MHPLSNWTESVRLDVRPKSAGESRNRYYIQKGYFGHSGKGGLREDNNDFDLRIFLIYPRLNDKAFPSHLISSGSRFNLFYNIIIAFFVYGPSRIL